MTWLPPSEVPASYACPTCLDVRRCVDRGWTDVPCPRCGTLDKDAYERLQADHARRTALMPDITALDLTPEEFELYDDWRKRFPYAHGRTLLSWIEGRRYDPSKDAEFLRDCEAALKRWRNDPDRITPEREEPRPRRRRAA